jgi:Glycine zipper
MKRKSLLLGLSFLVLTGCQTANQTNGAVGGGIIGGALGLGVGALTRNPGAGLAIGAGTGALVGTAVGANKDIKEAKAAQAQQQAYIAAHPPLSMTDVVQLANNGTSEAVIIQQMQTTNSVYNLTTADIQYLQGANVSQRVILEMQRRTPGSVVVVQPRPVYLYPPPPPPVAVGVGVRF